MPGQGRLRVVESPRCVDEVTMEAEVEALCPLTGARDRYSLVISYTPPRSAKGCRYVEAFSLSDYLAGYRGEKLLQEELASLIAHEVCAALHGGLVRVTLEGSHGPVRMRVTKALSCSGEQEASTTL